MKRQIYNELKKWKNKKSRMPLILKGARQVGKSYILNDFGCNEFTNCYKFDFEKDAIDLKLLFEGSLSPHKLLENLSLYINKNINPTVDIIIFDEIQNCSKALTSLKYFAEEMPELAVCCAGSLLGITLIDDSFPVGKVDYLELFPMNFEEFLIESNQPMLLELFQNSKRDKEIPIVAHTKLLELLKEFYVVGGMPQAVNSYFENIDNKVVAMKYVRKIQNNLIETYKSDFNKHSGKTNANHLSIIFDSIAEQLSGYMEDNTKRYKFKNVISKKKSYYELETTINWLIHAGLVLKVRIAKKAELPLQTFCEDNIFKLYIFDIGILGAMLSLKPMTIMVQDYGLVKGFFVENFVACELKASGEKYLYSWKKRNSEIEFLKDDNGEIIPIEVKSGNRTKAKSFKQYLDRYSPKYGIMISGKELDLKKVVVKNYPLYLSGKIFK